MTEYRAVTRPGFRWPVGATRALSVSNTRVWEAISTPGNLEFAHPFCESNPVSSWPGSGSRDEIHYLNGRVYERRFTNWIEGVGYDLEIGPPGGESSFVSWRIHPVDEETSRLEIVVCPYILEHQPVAVRWVPYLFVVRPRLRSYLSSVLRGFEWWITNNEAVPRNRFGRHPWFS